MTASPTDDLASAERRNQELTKKLSQARGELADAREQQTAAAQILAAISKSPTGRHHVFQVIAESAGRVCDANDATIFQVEEDNLRLIAHHGPIPPTDTLPLTRRLPSGCSILDRRTIQVANLQTETDEFPEGSKNAIRLGFCTVLAVPLIVADQAIGVTAIRRIDVRPFNDRQIDLLQTFADQAVIAIENARLFEEAQTRTRELSEALAQQTATSEILGAISSSPGELAPVFNAIIEN